MKTKEILTVIAAGLLSSGMTFGAENDLITKSFKSTAGGKLVMNVDRGSIRIHTSDSDQVEVRVERELRRGSNARAREVYEQHQIEITQSGNTVQIKADNPQRGFGLRELFNNLRVEYNISLPSRFDLDIRTAGGNIDIMDLDGLVSAQTSGGNVSLGAMKGEINAHTSGGSITINRASGKTRLRTSGGNVRAGEINGDLEARTSGGNITVERVNGGIQAETSGGHIRIQEAHGPVMARTSGGNVSAQLLDQPKGACALRTSGGSVEVTLASDLALDLTARTSGGSIQSDFPGELNKQRTRLAAQLNGGGPDLLLETSGGNVKIRKQ